MKLKDNNSRLRLLLVEKALLDNPEGLKMSEIISYLQQHDLTAERKTILQDLYALNYLYDVQYTRCGHRHILRRLPES